MEWLLEIVLLVLLSATLFQALRLERALGVLKRDRASLEELVNGFNASTHAAEDGIERLRAATEGAGRGIQRQIEAANGLKDDLAFLSERGERLADRLETLVRQGRGLAQESPGEPFLPSAPLPGPGLATAGVATAGLGGPERPADPSGTGTAEPRLRSQAERDLLRALRAAR